MSKWRWLAAAVLMAAAACSGPRTDRGGGTVTPVYDKTTGKLRELKSDRNHNGVIDTWTEMDGARPVLSRIDTNDDGKIDRWEYYDATGRIAKIGLSRKDDGKPDAWAYPAPDGTIARVDVSSTGDEHKIDRWEYYVANQLVRVEEDTNGDGRPDEWETYANGVLETVSFDQDGDGVADRRLTYQGGEVVSIETEPDGHGGFAKKVAVKSSDKPKLP